MNALSLSGESEYIITGDGGNGVFLMLLESDGTVLWYNLLTETGGYHVHGEEVRRTEDGGYIVSAEIASVHGHYEDDAGLIRTDSDGNTQWISIESGNNDDTPQEFVSAVELESGNVLVVGEITSYNGGWEWPTAACFREVDPEGNQVWQGVYNNSYSLKIQKLTSDAQMVLCRSWDDIGGYELIEINANRDTSLFFRLPVIDFEHSVKDFFISHDGSFYLSGDTSVWGHGDDILLIKLDNDGNRVWTRNYNGNPMGTDPNASSGDDHMYTLAPTDDGGCAIAGKRIWYPDGASWTQHLLLIRVDTNGNLLWKRSIPIYTRLVGDIAQCNDGGFIVNLNGNAENYVVKTDSYGFVDGVTSISGKESKSFAILDLYPNPFNSGLTISFDGLIPAATILRVHNMLGQLVHFEKKQLTSKGSNEYYWDATSTDGGPVDSGLYIFTIESLGISQSKKALLLK